MSDSNLTDSCERLAEAIDSCDAVLVGAGAGLSSSSGLAYDGPRFERLFSDFAESYGIRDMYSGGFYPFPTSEERWAWWGRHIWYNRYEREVGPAYEALARLVGGRDHFVLTTNVDHCFQDAGFEKDRLFYTQGDYGLWQCSLPCHKKTYDNREAVRRMVSEQSDMRIPSELVPRCPVCGREMTMNLRADETFVEDAGWHAASARYSAWLASHASGKVLYLELGVGGNTPGIVKFPFWSRVERNSQAVYAVVNKGEAYMPQELRERSIAVDGDIAEALETVEGILGLTR